jgi:hypothetical protein
MFVALVFNLLQPTVGYDQWPKFKPQRCCPSYGRRAGRPPQADVRGWWEGGRAGRWVIKP